MASQEAQLEATQQTGQLPTPPLPPLNIQNVLKSLLTPPAIIILTQRNMKGPGRGWQIGKTNTGFLLEEIGQRLGVFRQIGSNTPSLDGRIDFIDSFAALDFWGRQNRDRKCFLWDDANQFLIYSETMSGMAKAIFKLAPTLSKSNMTVIIVLHQENLMVKRLIESEAFIRGKIKKLSRTQAIIYMAGQKYPLNYVPSTSIKYDPKGRATFTLESKIGYLLDRTDLNEAWDWTHGVKLKDIRAKYQVKYDWQVMRDCKRVFKALLDQNASMNLFPQLRGLIETQDKIDQTTS